MTVETHGMQFVVDASGVAKGFRDYEAAVDGIFKSLDTFEKKVASTMSAIERAASNRAALAGFKKSLDQFSNIKIDTAAASKLSALSAAMGGFRAPSEAQSANTRKFFSSLSNLPDLSKAYSSIKNLDALKSAMASFKAPPLAQANNTLKFAQAIEKAAPAFRSLGRIAGISGVANELASISIAMREMKVPSASEITRIGNLALALQHLGRVNTGETGNMLHALAGIGNFKAPSKANIDNLVRFAEALHQIKPIPNAPLIAEQMNLIASAASRASVSLGGFRGNLGGFNPAYGRFNEGTRSAKVEMMGLQNAFSGTFQVGSVLRSLLGSLTVAELGRAFFQATQTANQFTAAMETVGVKTEEIPSQWERVRESANHFGADLNQYSENFSKFAMAAHENGVSIGEASKIFEGFQTVMTGTHMGTEQMQSVGLAIREMMDQGYVSSARITRQLGLVLPGATHTLVEAWKSASKTHDSLFDAMKKKEVDSTWALDVLAKHYKETYAKALTQALESPIQQFRILRNNIVNMMVDISDAGPKKAFADLLKQISGYMDPDHVGNFAQTIGGALTKAINKLSEAVKFLHDHWNTLVVPLAHVLKLMAEWEILMSVMKIGQWMISPITTLVGVFGGLGKSLTSTITLFKALKTAELEAGAASYAKGLGGRAAGIVKQAPSAVGKTGEAIGSADLAARMSPGFQKLFELITKTKGLLADFGESAVGQFVTKFTTGIGVVTKAFGLIGVGLQIAWAAGTQAAEDNGIKMQHSAYSTTEIIRGAWLMLTDKIAGAWHSVTNWVSAKWAELKAPIINGALGMVHGIIDAFTFLSYSVYTIMYGILHSIQGVWNAAGAGLSKLASAGHKVTQGDLKGAIADAAGMGGAAADAFKGAFAGHMSFGQYKANVGIGAAAVNNELVGIENTLGARARAEDAKNAPKAGPPRAKPASDNPQDKTDPLYHGIDGKGKKGKKGKDPYTAINKSENAVDDLMKSLNAGDPIAKLYTDFTKTITKESKDLLTAPGHKQWLAQVRADGKTADELAASQTTALIHQLESGQGINKKNLADLEKRYGKTIPDIVRLLKNQLDDLHDHEVASMKKTIDDDNKAIIEARKKIAEFDPETKNNLSFTETMEPFAEKFFAPDKYQAWYKAVQTGALGTGVAFDELKTRMIAAIAPGGAMHDEFVKLGISGERLVQILNGMGAGWAYEAQKAKDSQVFGKELLDQKADELKLMGLSNDQAEIMKTVQGEVQKALAAHQQVDAQWISDLKQQLELNQKLEHQMQRNQEFFAGNGIRDYLNGLQDVGTAVNDLDKNFLGSLNDQLVSLGETGKFSFNKIFDTIRNGMIKMAADGLTKKFASMFFGEDKLNGGQPSFFGSTIGKWMGGYGPNQKDPYGSSGPDPKYFPWATKNLGIDPATAKLTSAGLLSPSANGSSALTALWVKDANNPMGTLGGAAGAGGGLGLPVPGLPGAAGNSPITKPFGGADDLFDMGPGGGGSSLLDMMQGGGKNDPTTVAGTKVANSFMGSMSSIMPMIGLTFAGAFKSPIAQTAAMFGSMLLQQLMQSQMAGGAGGGGGGGLGGIFGKLLGGLFGGGGGMSAGSANFMSDTAELMGYREGGIVGYGVGGTYRASPSAFVNAPHYSEGTANTSGIPAILHDNEAVIPLSRGREVPVKLTNKQSHANGQSVQVNFTVHAADADSFQQSKQQIMADLHGAMVRSFSRNY